MSESMMKVGMPCIAVLAPGNIAYTQGTPAILQNETTLYTHSVTITAMSSRTSTIIFGDVQGQIYSLDPPYQHPKLLGKCSGHVNYLTVRQEFTAVAADQECPVLVSDTQEKTMIKGHTGGVLSANLDEKEKYLASFGYDGYVNAYNAQTRELLTRMMILGKPVKEMSANRYIGDFYNNRYGLPGDLTFRYLHPPIWKYEPTSKATNTEISIIKWIDDNLFVTADMGTKIIVWDIMDEEPLEVHQVSGTVTDLAVSGADIHYVTRDGDWECIANLDCLQAEIPVNEVEEQAIDDVDGQNNGLFDSVIGILPQKALSAGTWEETGSVLCRNFLGKIVLKNIRHANSEESFIDIQFMESGFHPPIFFENDKNYNQATMNTEGALLASGTLEDEEIDEGHRGKLKFVSFRTSVEWTKSFAAGETPVALAVGSDFCAVATSKNYLRLFNLGGLEILIVNLPMPIVALSAYITELCIVYHRGPPLLYYQNLLVELWHLEGLNMAESPETFVKEEIALGVSYGESLKWIGYSNEGHLFALDSSKSLKVYWRRLGHWVPVCAFKEIELIVDISGDLVYGISAETSNLVTESLSLPLLNGPGKVAQESIVKRKLLDDLSWNSKALEVSTKEIDTHGLKAFMNAINEGDEATALGFYQQFSLVRTKTVAVAYLQKTGNESFLRKYQYYLGLELPSRETSRIPPKPDQLPSDSKLATLIKSSNETAPSQSLPPASSLNPFAKPVVPASSLEEALTSKRKIDQELPAKKVKGPKK